ncbi:TPR repeat-containing protein [Calothrix sp. NIES-4071]|nr:TPR repeat-containing protein [Calothrix sp. NIES-4071]BAZ59346.1 TPR repeat-containing protein [Calothrix sp. NIES-4105]
MNIERATLLIEQSRYQMAERELRQALAQAPSDAYATALLGLCLNYQQRYQEAIAAAGTAISLAPDDAFSHYTLSCILCERWELELAEKSIREAIRLNCYQASYFALLSRCKYNQKLWQDALDAAQNGLAIDPENVECLNYRALSLSQLGKGDQAVEVIESAIATAPLNASCYASSGWILLSHGKSHQKALEYFREALRLNPNLEWARSGIIEALKAQNPLYRLMRSYFLWSSRLNNTTRWVFTIGLYFAVRFLLVGLNQVGLKQLVIVVAIGYLLFVILTWIIDPLFTLLLRFDKFGRLALTETEILQSNYWGACFGIAILSFFVYLFTNHNTALIGAAVFGLLLIPTAASFHCEIGFPRKTMRIYTISLAVLGCLSIILSLANTIWIIPMALFLVGAVASSWVATLLTTIKAKK